MSTMTNRNLDGPQPELVLIQYPGIIKNVDKALETLGGLQTISQVRCVGAHFFELFLVAHCTCFCEIRLSTRFAFIVHQNGR